MITVKITADYKIEIILNNESVILDDPQVRELIDDLIENQKRIKCIRNDWINGIERVYVS